MSDSSKKILAKVVRNTSIGPDLDKLIGTVIFQMKIEECDVSPEGQHLIGSVHYPSPVANDIKCSLPLPHFSQSWEHAKDVTEWITSHFGGFDIGYDCGRWHCNINSTDEAGKWFRISSISGSLGMQEALWKAALLALINPQIMPLAYRPQIAHDAKKRKKRGQRKRTK